MRKLASIQRVQEIKPIDGADAIEAIRINGWWVVDKKGLHNVGDLVVYIEVDSWVPHELVPFLSKGKEPREFNGVKGERLCTVKLRGQLSQGFLLPRYSVLDKVGEIFDGMDVSELLGIQKWEPTVPAILAGNAKGVFPSDVPKTDQERIQNITQQEFEKLKLQVFEVSEKLEGSSCTMYLDTEGEFHVCSRNLELHRDENNSFWKAAIHYNVEQEMKDNGLFGYAIQGELIGPGIQGNIYGLTHTDFCVFDIYSTVENKYIDGMTRRFLTKWIKLKHVPVLSSNFKLTSVDELLTIANGSSEVGSKPNREGLVFKAERSPMVSFKAISNEYLLKQK